MMYSLLSSSGLNKNESFVLLSFSKMYMYSGVNTTASISQDSSSSESLTPVKEIQQRLHEIDEARNDYINLIASGVMDEEVMDEQFQKLYAEEQDLNTRLRSLEESNNINDDQKTRISQALQLIDNSSCELAEYKDMLIRKLIECVKVNSKTEITIIFKGGYEVTAEVEK